MVLSLSIIILLLIRTVHDTSFDPDTRDYNAYGLKVAANDYLIIEAQNQEDTFYIQFGPYNSNVLETSQRFCSIYFERSSQYIYSVAIGKNQSSNQLYFFFVGEITGIDEDELLPNRIFIGILNYTDSPVGPNSSADCSLFEYNIEYINNSYKHQQYLTLAVEPLGLAAYGFCNDVSFSYDAQTEHLRLWPGNSFWPNFTFMPHAVDYKHTYGVIAGFVDNRHSSRVEYSPFVYLFTMNVSTAPTVLASWTYTVTGSWQAGRTNSGANLYDAKYDMSVAINDLEQALVGIPSMNSVFLFSINGSNMILVASQNNGRSLGYGKATAWLGFTGTSVAILVNSYTFGYSWLSSQIYIYDDFTNTSTPATIFPNSQQILSENMASIILTVVSTPTHLAFLDINGNIFVILSSPAGFFSSTVGSDEQSVAAFSDQIPCIAGTYKNQTSIRPCSPCPTGTKNPGNSSMSCVTCAPGTFCSLGAASDISSSALGVVSQARAYPKSPENTVFDDILIQNMFNIGSTSHCTLVSPIFWALIVAIFAFLIMGFMTVLKYYTKYPKGALTQKKLTSIFKQTDLIGEGEQWIGGLVSFCIVALLICAYTFSNAYFMQYPIETVGPSNFACDRTTRNAKFETSLQSLAVPLTKEEQEMFDLLDNQQFMLNVDFVNTVFSCDDGITAFVLLGSSWQALSIISCLNFNYILSISVALPYKGITVRFVLPYIYTIGGLRVGLSGRGKAETLKNLEFYQSFNSSGKMLAHNVEVTMQITKVINETIALVGDETKLSGLWIPSFTINLYNSFISQSAYVRQTTTQTNLTVIISETPYYIKNEQQPIAKQPEIIFHTLLFTTVVLEIFGLIFLISKLMLIPLLSFIVKKCRQLLNHVRGKELPNDIEVHDKHPNIELQGENENDA
ncbi:unnamed protein product [Didymodactylos carnosus]|uniref:Uncharacterized protein n=1 Tax=Didymodactylos carnosus TaxID=1234261 RepID=A0A815RM73_9BILA|nr:unnamed protein product [Didymodactylos carnosus]CAF1478951.1 unnamed protein product [Didymodactylos carnosus]CAF4138771.1 unnamed protein product [Didymodactylos carnosus]CAF4344416.1 unnamed protein product [Didymodactylos carnosus]